MKTNRSIFEKLAAVLRRPGRKPAPTAAHDADVSYLENVDDQSASRLTPLDRITKHLRRLGLGQRVRVRFEAAGHDYVLEDADGFIHAKDYDDAVAVIERIWLYQP